MAIIGFICIVLLALFFTAQTVIFFIGMMAFSAMNKEGWIILIPASISGLLWWAAISNMPFHFVLN